MQFRLLNSDNWRWQRCIGIERYWRDAGQLELQRNPCELRKTRAHIHQQPSTIARSRPHQAALLGLQRRPRERRAVWKRLVETIIKRTAQSLGYLKQNVIATSKAADDVFSGLWVSTAGSKRVCASHYLPISTYITE